MSDVTPQWVSRGRVYVEISTKCVIRVVLIRKAVAISPVPDGQDERGVVKTG